jgi:hypothetical protein
LGKAAVTGGIEEVFIYITKVIMRKIAARLNEKYSIQSKAAKWGKKVVSRVKARIPHTPLSLPTTRLVDTLYRVWGFSLTSVSAQKLPLGPYLAILYTPIIL